jgi:hypothetical protein
MQLEHVSLICFLSDRCSGATAAGLTPFEVGEDDISREDPTPPLWASQIDTGEPLEESRRRIAASPTRISSGRFRIVLSASLPTLWSLSQINPNPLLSVLQHPRLHHAQRCHLQLMYRRTCLTPNLRTPEKPAKSSEQEVPNRWVRLPSLRKFIDWLEYGAVCAVLGQPGFTVVTTPS